MPENVEELQRWYEHQMRNAAQAWELQFRGRYEAGDDVPDSGHYISLWIAERAHLRPTLK